FGGSGVDVVDGGVGDDIVIGGTTTYYNEGTRAVDLVNLRALLQEWSRTDADYATRVSHLSAGGGVNGGAVLNASTVTADAAAVDTLWGREDADWFLAGAEDLVKDLDLAIPEIKTTV